MFFIDSGTLHAIGKGILICEIQQNSNTTYRIYDYGRVGKDGKPRELHVKKAIDVTKLEPPTKPTTALAKIDIIPGLDMKLLAECEYFTAYHATLKGEASLKAGSESFQTFTVLSGSLKLTSGDTVLDFYKGESVFIPAGLGIYTLTGDATFILSKM